MPITGWMMRDKDGALQGDAFGAEAKNVTLPDGTPLPDKLLTYLEQTGDGGDLKPTFVEAASRVNIYSGLKLSTILGYIKKFFADLKPVAFSGVYTDLTGRPTTMAPTAHAATHKVGGVDAMSKADVGLGNVDNTADTSKPVSTLQQAAINARAVKVLYTATLSATWTTASVGFTQTLAISGILASDTPTVGVVQGSNAETNKILLENWGRVNRITTAANSITAYAFGEKPTAAIPIQLLCIR